MKKTVVVLGKTVTALGTLRAVRPLKKQGYKIILGTTDRKDNIALKSNIPNRKVIFSEGLIKGLQNLAKEFDSKPILLFTRDADVVEISENRKKIEPLYNFLLPSHEVVETLMEKGKFADFAEVRDLPVPKTIFVRTEEELKSIATHISFPIILKPYMLHAVRIDNERQLEQLAHKLEALHYHSMIAQEYIEGEDDNLFFCFLLFNKNGELVHSMNGRKLRQWPVSYGTTSLAITIENKKLDKEVQKFVKTTDLVGYCSIEYKYDINRDRYVIMEPTIGRFNQQIALSIASGVNFPIAMVKLLDGEEVKVKPQKNAIRWIYESNDLMSYFRSKTRYGYLKNFFKPKIQVLYSFTDPGPFLYELIDLAKKKLKKLISLG